MELVIIQIVVQVGLTILGWFIVAWWAIEQAKIAHINNKELQVNLIKETHKSILRNELLEIYKSIVQSASTLKQQLLYYYFNNGLSDNDMQFGSSKVNKDINIAYTRFTEEMTRLEMWLKITNQELQHITSILDAQVEYRNTFTAGAIEGEASVGLWVTFQGILISNSPKKSDSEVFKKTMQKLDTSLEAIMNSLANGVSEVNQKLIND